METINYETTPEAEDKRKARWRQRGIITARVLSVRMDRAAAIILRAILNYHRAQRAASLPLPPKLIRGHNILKATFDVTDDFGGVRGIIFWREAVAMAKQVFPPLDEPGDENRGVPADCLKAAYWMAKAAAEAARAIEAGVRIQPYMILSTRRFFKMLTQMMGESSVMPPSSKPCNRKQALDRGTRNYPIIL